MPRTSPLTVTYRTLQTLADQVLRESKERHARAKACGAGNLDALTARVANADALVKMLKRCEPGKQADMHQLFQSVQQ